MIPIHRFVLVLASLLLIGGCSENKSQPGSESPQSGSSIPDKTICELLPKETMSSITGFSFNEERKTLHQTDNSEGKYVSQCGYDGEGISMSVMVRRFGDSSYPTEKEKLIGGPKTGDAEMDAMMDEAIQTAKTVTGLGDAAYFYNLGGLNNLVVIFHKHYELRITSFGKGLAFDDATMEVSKKVADKVIPMFN